MGQTKPWQLILIVVGLLVCAGSVAYYMFGRQTVHMGTRIDMVDLVTGDRWWVDVSGSRRVTLPAKNPETGKRTLVQAVEEDGVWKSDQIAAAANFEDRKTFKAVDSFDRGTLNVSAASVKEYKPGG